MKFVFTVFTLLLVSCNFVFFVSKENVIYNSTGYLYFDPYYRYVKFIPSKIDTSLSLSENLTKHKLGKAFYMIGLPPNELSNLRIFGDTLENGWSGWIIIPVELKYRELNKLIHRVGKQSEEYTEDFLVVEKKIYYFKLRRKHYRYFNAYPLLSQEKMRQKAKYFED